MTRTPTAGRWQRSLLPCGRPPAPPAAAEPDRDTLALAALLSGYTIDSAGYGLHHVLSQTLARLAGVGHGPSNAVMLPHTLVALEQRGASGAAALIPLATDLAHRAGASRLGDLGVDEATLDRCADAACRARRARPHSAARRSRRAARALRRGVLTGYGLNASSHDLPPSRVCRIVPSAITT